MFTILSIAFGLAFLFWIQCVLVGHEKNMIETITSTFTGDIQIHKDKYLEDRLVQYYFDPSPTLIQNLDAAAMPWSKRVYFPAIIASSEFSLPVVLVGIDPGAEAKITKLKTDVKSGNYLEKTDICAPGPIMVSARLAEKLNTTLDEKLVLMGQDANGSIGNQLFRVRGIFDTNSRDFDKLYAFTTLECAQSIAALTGVHEIIVKSGSTGGDDFTAKNRVDSFVPEELATSTWRDIVIGVANLIRFNKALSSLIAFILFSVITLGVTNSVLMNIFERVREIGIMLAIGTTPTQVRIIIIFESFLIAVLGAVLGTLLGLIAVFYHQQVGFDMTPFLGKAGVSGVGFTFPTTVYPVIQWQKYSQLLVLEIVFIVLAGLYPAFKASRLKPTETIRG